MRLYRMELYKLWHKKAFVICAVFAMLLVTVYFIGEVQSEIAMVDGERYFGYEAVKVNRQITEEYRGELTDEKVDQIVSRYGLPSEIVYDYRGWRDSNYLNGFVTEYLSDGYMYSWDNYKAPTRAYPIADTELSEFADTTGIVLAYTKGWETFFDILQLAMVLASVLVIISISVVYAQEGQTRMMALVFTTQEGKDKDVWAKIAAAFTLTIIVYSVTVLLCLGLCFCVFGLDGGECPLSIALLQNLYAGNSAGYMPVASFAWVTLGVDLLAMLLLCAMTMCVSAHCKSSFAAVTTAAVVWCMPLLFGMLFGGLGYFIANCMPMFLFMKDMLCEAISRGTMAAMLYVIAAVFVICMVEGYQVYRRGCG